MNKEKRRTTKTSTRAQEEGRGSVEMVAVQAPVWESAVATPSNSLVGQVARRKLAEGVITLEEFFTIEEADHLARTVL